MATNQDSPPSENSPNQVSLPEPDPMPEMDRSKRTFNTSPPARDTKDQPSSITVPEATNNQGRTQTPEPGSPSLYRASRQPSVDKPGQLEQSGGWNFHELVHRARFHGTFVDLEVKFGSQLAMDLVQGIQFASWFDRMVNAFDTNGNRDVYLFTKDFDFWYTEVLAFGVRVMSKRPDLLSRSAVQQLNDRPMGRIRSDEELANYLYQMKQVAGDRFTTTMGKIVYEVLTTRFRRPIRPSKIPTTALQDSVAECFHHHNPGPDNTNPQQSLLPSCPREPNALARFATLPHELQLAIWEGFWHSLWRDVTTAREPLPLVFNVVYRDQRNRGPYDDTIGGTPWRRPFALVPSLRHDAPCGGAGFSFFQRVYALAATCRDSRDVLLTRALGVPLWAARRDGGLSASRALYGFGWLPRDTTRIVVGLALRPLPRQAAEHPAREAARLFPLHRQPALRMVPNPGLCRAAARLPARTAQWMQRQAEWWAAQQASAQASGEPLAQRVYAPVQVDMSTVDDRQVHDGLNNNYLCLFQDYLRVRGSSIDPVEVLNPKIPAAQFPALRDRSAISFLSPPYTQVMKWELCECGEEFKVPVLKFWDQEYPKEWMSKNAYEINEFAAILLGRHWRQASRFHWQPNTHINGCERNLVEVVFDDELLAA